MTYKKTTFFLEIYFLLIFLSGLFYTFLLVILASKILPGFTMQFVFLFDSLKFNSAIPTSLVASRMFLTNILSGAVLIWLLFSYAKLLLHTIRSVMATRGLLANYPITRRGKDYITYQSDDNRIFTVGFFNPKIYLSATLLKTHTPTEVKAMLYHEQNHQNNLHPLKTLIVRFIQSLLPPIPAKNWLVDNYVTLLEVSSDQFAESHVSSKLPLVSALLKFEGKIDPLLSTASSYYNSQSERIAILVGNKRQTLSTPLLLTLLIPVFMLFSAYYVNSTSLFFNCRHVVDCIKVLLSPQSQPLLKMASSNQEITALSSSSHCQ